MAQPAATNARRLALLTTATALLAVALALPAQGGTADAPEVTDAPDDAGFAPLDIASAWFDANGTTLRVHLARGDGSDSPSPAVACQQGACVGAGVSLRVVYTVLRADGTPAPALTGYAASYVLVRLGPDDPAFAAVAGFYDSAGTATVKESVPVTIAGADIEVDVPLSSETVAMPDGLLWGSRISAPYALSYAMACEPKDGCLNAEAPAEQVASLWDRAPDSGTGADYWLPAPADNGTGSATQTSTASASTVTVVQTQTQTVTRTETRGVTETVTITPDAAATEAKASPAAGILVAAGIVALAAVRRRLA
jgi:hypothetical protein